MSIASQITRINNNIASAYTACNTKGATMPATQNSANLANCISSISGGDGGGSVTDYLSLPILSLTCEVFTQDNTDVVNVYMQDYSDTLYTITGKHFNETEYDDTTGTWVSNDGTLTLKVDKSWIVTSMKYDNTSEYPSVSALYGYFPDWASGTGDMVLGICLINEPNSMSSIGGTMLCLTQAPLNRY